ncbi:hypothetical protein GOODEAATRI_000566, partial [Goodea atripinnis]
SSRKSSSSAGLELCCIPDRLKSIYTLSNGEGVGGYLLVIPQGPRGPDFGLSSHHCWAKEEGIIHLICILTPAFTLILLSEVNCKGSNLSWTNLSNFFLISGLPAERVGSERARCGGETRKRTTCQIQEHVGEQGITPYSPDYLVMALICKLPHGCRTAGLASFPP